MCAGQETRTAETNRNHAADPLFEIVVDKDGKVRKARLLRTHVRPEYHEDMLSHARRFVFSEDAEGEMFRAFYFPTRYRYNAEFEWAHR